MLRSNVHNYNIIIHKNEITSTVSVMRCLRNVTLQRTQLYIQWFVVNSEVLYCLGDTQKYIDYRATGKTCIILIGYHVKLFT